MTVRVLVVDDSLMMRQVLTKLLGDDPSIEVVGAARDPYEARDMIKQLHPDVMTLDIEMPRMSGLAFLEKVMTLRPMPVVMVSTLTEKGADATLQALELGAVDFVAKPASGAGGGLEHMASDIRRKVKIAARRGGGTPRRSVPAAGHLTALPRRASPETIVALGASTGGVQVLREIIERLPAETAPVLVTQHMPPVFTKRFAERLDRAARMSVSEATDGCRVLPGHVYIAPGGRHLLLGKSGGSHICEIGDGPPVSGHKPSVDVLFRSVAEVAGRSAVGVILTGMGSDGAQGLRAMREAGARTLGQSEASCIVYGMPRVAMEVGAVEEQLPAEALAERILSLTSDPDERSARGARTDFREPNGMSRA